MRAMKQVKVWGKPYVQRGASPLLRALAPQVMQFGSFWPHGAGTLSYSRPTGEATPRAADGFPVPPRELWAGYCTNEDSFLASGREDCKTMEKILADGGTALADAEAILDLGCAGGRMIRHLPGMAPRARIWGADIWSGAILWCQDNLRPPCSFVVSTMSPHLPFRDGSFDLVYCGSLFTHIDDLAETWFAELHRILRSGGRLYFSVNDQHAMQIYEGKGDAAAYAGYYERTGGKEIWDSFLAQLSRDPGYQRFRRGEAYMFTMGRAMSAHVMWDSEVLCERLSWGYRRLSVNLHSYGHQSTVLLEKI